MNDKTVDAIVDLCNHVVSARCALNSPKMDGSEIRAAKEHLDAAHKLISRVLSDVATNVCV